MIGMRNQWHLMMLGDKSVMHAICGKTTEMVTPSLPGIARQQELATGLAYSYPDRKGISSSVGRGSRKEGSLHFVSGFLSLVMHRV